jgi:hypothetical protein
VHGKTKAERAKPVEERTDGRDQASAFGVDEQAKHSHHQMFVTTPSE